MFVLLGTYSFLKFLEEPFLKHVPLFSYLLFVDPLKEYLIGFLFTLAFLCLVYGSIWLREKTFKALIALTIAAAIVCASFFPYQI